MHVLSIFFRYKYVVNKIFFLLMKLLKPFLYLDTFKCEWLSLILIRNGKNVEFISGVTHIPNIDLQFWIEMWRLTLVIFEHWPFISSKLPNKWYQSRGSVWWGNRSCYVLYFKCKWLSLILTINKKNVGFIRNMTHIPIMSLV
jgi:hypothetical protein